MNNRDYQEQAQLMDRRDYQDFALDARKARIMHAAMGAAGEIGELVDIIKKHVFYQKELDIQHVIEESGDAFWYFAILFDTLGASFEEVMKANIDKLRKRYPNGFSEANALKRLDKHGIDG